MDIKTATVVVSNLIERLSQQEFGAGCHLTAIERTALQALSDLGKGDLSAPVSTSELPRGKGTGQPAILKHAVATSNFALDRRAFTESPQVDVSLCIDFGTAYSKAAFWDETKESGDIDDGARCCRALPIGREAQETNLVYPVSSSVYISSDGRISFGPQAIAVSRLENDSRRSRFDNPKEHLSKSVRETFYTQVLPPEIDPTGSGLTYYEVLQAYLAFLTARASQAAGRMGYSGLLKRRFAVPNWTGEKSEFVEKEMRRILLDAQVLADSIDPTVWGDGMSVEFLRHALKLTREATAGAESNLIEHAIFESTAAASGAVAKVRNHREIFLVADIGAGTCDMGLYYVVSPDAKSEKPAKFASLCDSREVLNQAGRFLDDQLRMMMLEKAGVDPGSLESHRFRPQIDREIQDQKHLLFATDSCQVTFGDQQTIEITVGEFEQRQQIRQFSQVFSKYVERLLKKAGRDNLRATRFKVHCVLTGGGASIPFLRRIFSQPMQLEDDVIHFELVDPTPEWVIESDEALARTYPQMSVAMGGCDPSLPKEVRTVRHIGAPETSIKVGSIVDGYRTGTRPT